MRGREASDPVNKESKRLSFRECVHLTKLLSNFAISTQESIESVMSQWRHGHEPYWKPDYEI